MTAIASHISPYKRIEFGSRAPAPAPANSESAFAKAVREAAEDKARAEHDRIWNHVVQTARGTCAVPEASDA